MDVLIGDTAILDYFRANDPGCNLNLLGDSIFDDAYAVAMQKGFPLKVSLHSVAVTSSAFLSIVTVIHAARFSRLVSKLTSFSASSHVRLIPDPTTTTDHRALGKLQQAISNLILEYSTYGFLDQLQRKWFVIRGQEQEKDLKIPFTLSSCE